MLSRLVVDDEPRREGYDRDDWGGGWSDADRDCLNTRHEVLMTEEIRSSPFLRADGCLVTGGRWFAAFTGTFVDDPRSLDVDHFVPLANAHRSGGWAWDRATKKRFANDLDDPRHLIAVTASANRSKGDKGPEAWRPPDESYWCDYADTWMDVKVRWGLTVTSARPWATARRPATERPRIPATRRTAATSTPMPRRRSGSMPMSRRTATWPASTGTATASPAMAGATVHWTTTTAGVK